jgi:hypothetical protein
MQCVHVTFKYVGSTVRSHITEIALEQGHILTTFSLIELILTTSFDNPIVATFLVLQCLRVVIYEFDNLFDKTIEASLSNLIHSSDHQA